MIKRKQNISLNILLVVVALLSVLMLSIGVGNAWFESSQNRGIQVSVRVSEFNVLLEQLTTVQGSETATEIYTYRKNARKETTKYITLSQMIQPEEDVDLKLRLTNNDSGDAVYLRYSLKLYACGVENDTEIDINVNVGESFNKSGDYYYLVSSGSTNKTFAKGDSVILCTGFNIPYSSFETMNGGETVRIELTIECANTIEEFN